MTTKGKPDIPQSEFRMPHAPDPEARLMQRVRRGDEAAFTELVGRYWSRVFGRLYHLLGDRHEAEDRAQEVFLRLYRARRRYRPRARFRTWIYHITRNVARNAVRSRQRHPCVPLWQLGPPDDVEQLTAALGTHRFEPPAAPLERADLARIVRQAVAGLDARQRTALELQQFHDHSYQEVADQMAVSPQAAKSLLYRARTELRARLRGLLAEV